MVVNGKAWTLHRLEALEKPTFIGFVWKVAEGPRFQTRGAIFRQIAGKPHRHLRVDNTSMSDMKKAALL